VQEWRLREQSVHVRRGQRLQGRRGRAGLLGTEKYVPEVFGIFYFSMRKIGFLIGKGNDDFGQFFPIEAIFRIK